MPHNSLLIFITSFKQNKTKSYHQRVSPGESAADSNLLLHSPSSTPGVLATCIPQTEQAPRAQQSWELLAHEAVLGLLLIAAVQRPSQGTLQNRAVLIASAGGLQKPWTGIQTFFAAPECSLSLDLVFLVLHGGTSCARACCILGRGDGAQTASPVLRLGCGRWLRDFLIMLMERNARRFIHLLY